MNPSILAAEPACLTTASYFLSQLWTDASGQGTDVSQMLLTAAEAVVELCCVMQLYRAHSALGRLRTVILGLQSLGPSWLPSLEYKGGHPDHAELSEAGSLEAI